jgi:hypothetical protein
VKGLGGALIVIAILIFFLAMMFAGQTISGHFGGNDWSITLPALPHPHPSPSPS